MSKDLVIIESPYAGQVERNEEYARRCMLDSLRNHNEAPFLSHLLYTQVLDDKTPEDRQLGVEAGHAWISSAHFVVCYTDYGLTPGMVMGLHEAVRFGIPIICRGIGKNPGDPS